MRDEASVPQLRSFPRGQPRPSQSLPNCRRHKIRHRLDNVTPIGAGGRWKRSVARRNLAGGLPNYAQTEHFVGDSLVVRQFCRLGLEPVPYHTTLLRWANLLQPETLHRLLDRVTQLARSLKVTRGRKLRIDSTVVETTIHHPSDSSLLADGVRVLSRLVRSAGDIVGHGTKPLFRDRTRSAKRLMRRIDASLARAVGRATEAKAERTQLYARLLKVAAASLRQAEQVRHTLTAAQRITCGLSVAIPIRTCVW